jgi:CheY-like chemotaxis protein
MASALLLGRNILWVDDHPEGNAWTRRLLTRFGAEVVPVLSNEEAVMEAAVKHFDVAVSDVDRGGAEPGTQLGVRLKAAGLSVPIIFFIAQADPSRPPPVGGVLVTNDTVALLARLLAILRPDALA